jgi:hypothetical protein
LYSLDQDKGYERQLQQQQTHLEDITEQFGVAEQECSRLSSEKGNFISKVILIIFMTEMFLNVHFRTVCREKKDNTDEGIVHKYHNPDRQDRK